MTRRWRIGLAITGGIVALLLLVLAAFPWGLLAGIVAREAGERFGRPVAIGSVERLDRFGLMPRLAIRDVRIAQADWAGTGDFARIGAVTLRLPVWPLLLGRIDPREVTVDGLHLALARDANGRTNWQRPGKQESGGAAPDLAGLAIRDATITYTDAKQDRAVRMMVDIDAAGLRAYGVGTIRGTPVRLAVAGAPPVAGSAWPFAARIAGADLAMRAKGSMDRPLDTDAMSLAVTARAADLKLIDAVIEAGLFRTRPVTLTAQVRHDPGQWRIAALKGRIGRSDLSGDLTVLKVDGRSKIDGRLAAKAFDFNDLTSAEGRARSAALEARIGPKLVPDTRIDIGKIDTTDGRLTFTVGRIIGTSAPPVLGLAGTLVMDHRRLTLAPLRLTLSQGVVTGRAVVDQHDGAPAPLVTLDLRLTGGDVAAFAEGGAFTGRMAARVRLTGRGETIRAAVGRSRGMIGFVVHDGRLPARYAAALGFDAGRALLAGRDDRAALRCMIAELAVKDGTARVDPLTVDTAISRMRGTGTLSFPAERLALTLTGAPKRDVILRIPGTVSVTGTLREPELVVPPQMKSFGNILKAIGRRISGNSGPVATDADCAGLARAALR
ncbi:AsmA family protein [Sphingomonas sp. KR1UV-12]|uniref:AsmA family protein n=1 Tax=Sphingomonas aurea TaxID=3063994 RepID=A0ABT9EM44_9SPHN|nr:AsmA family protein [Sphingomonas sp. KR1UV-12]MDP1027713.1 AsmA family protein [Sphingomonas sp. KR1UV-12]